ncbi:MAG: DNA repair protein RecN [Christensenellales bacterium]
MLRTLDIENVALIDRLTLELGSGLNVLSGETGAGKSIIIDSLNFVLGGKADKHLISQGKNFMRVTALFEGELSESLRAEMLSQGFDDCEQVIISRRFSADGKGDIRINGTPVTQSMLKAITSLLVDIHGQHEHQHLLKDKFHLEIIDGFIKNKKLFEQYTTLLLELKQLNTKIAKLNGSTDNQERLLDLLDYQIKEIESSSLKIGEDEELASKKLVMQNSEKIYDALTNCFELLDNVADNVKKAHSSLNSIAKFDGEFPPLAERLQSVKFEIMDIANTVKDKKQECAFDQYEFDRIDERLDKIKTIKRKYGATIDEVLQFLEKCKVDYNEIISSKDILKNLLAKKKTLLEQLVFESQKISFERRKVAREFETRVINELADLGMKNARFVVDFEDNPTLENIESRLKNSGTDTVKFMFSANKGQDLKPLAEIISGGEASRFMLALKNILAENDQINLMVFDEIDTGISGEMGYMVACKLANISAKHQVVSVSHLPQICAMADRNIKVEKFDQNGKTCVRAFALSDDETLQEIARLSGGAKQSEVSAKHAMELRNRCNTYKKIETK